MNDNIKGIFVGSLISAGLIAVGIWALLNGCLT